MSNYTATMQRNEKKYCLNSKQHIQLIEAMFPFTEQDHYGNHTISNLYMDNDDFDSISKSMDKPIYKEKLRLRTYTTPSDEDQVFLEI